MATFSVADAKNKLPSLIDRALGGEDVVITRHGKPVVELRPAAAAPAAGDRRAIHEWFMARRLRPHVPVNSLEVIDQMREESVERVLGHKRPDPKPRRRTDQRGG
jgi:prevent-host-death family protein